MNVRPRRAKGRNGELFVSFLLAVSDDAMKAMSTTIKRWRLHLWNRQTLTELAQDTNKQVRGWINYYGRFCSSVLTGFLRRIDEYLVRWAMRKYKRLKGRRMRTWEFLARVKTREPNLFAHWRPATQTNGRMMGAV